ncbi:MAG: CxxxxCH/CxxCH domain-containing protein [Myxococcota bacterium]
MRTLALLLLAACDDTIFPAPTHGGGGEVGEGYCGVQTIFASQCVACHSTGGRAGGLDLETSAHSALVGVSSALYPDRTLVVPGAPDASFLYAKVTGAAAASEGTPMPPSAGLSAEDAAVLRAWIADGASEACTDVIDPSDGHHPPGWEAPDVHGMAAKHQDQTCVMCHGPDLAGGDVGVSCDTCHEDGGPGTAWRTDCTFCHGGVDNLTGAPPEGISDETDAADTSFPVHTTHVQDTSFKSAFDCVQCHVKPTDVLSSGHVFLGDTTPGVADLSFVAGLSPAAEWERGTCSNLYCHGNGRSDNGSVSVDSTVRCGSCHAVQASGEDAWERLSAPHEDHLEEGVTCNECHGEVVSAGDVIAHPELHVNGSVSVRLPSGMTRASETCTGSCHGESHGGRRWEDD